MNILKKWLLLRKLQEAQDEFQAESVSSAVAEKEPEKFKIRSKVIYA